MWKLLVTRVLQAIFTLWVVSVVVFFSARITGECVPPFTHDICVRAVRLALPPVLREARPAL